MSEPASVTFDRLAGLEPPEDAPLLFDTACVLGGSIAGLLAARVLADHARRVVVIERDSLDVEDRPRPSVPQDQHIHTLLPGGERWMERWLPGLTKEMQDKGAVIVSPAQLMSYRDGRPVVREAGEHLLVLASRPFIESRIRSKVLSLPNIEVMRSQATGLEYSGDSVSAVRCGSGAATNVIPADFVIDAMGRASRLSDWLSRDGYQAPQMRRLSSRVNYVTARFKTASRPDELAVAGVATRWSPPYPVDGVALASVSAIEHGEWLVLLAAYDDARPGDTLAGLRSTCAKLPSPLFTEVSSGALVGEIATYRLADNRRRDFVSTRRFPARLVSVGDAVASFNPLYGQGISAAAYHASCLSEYLNKTFDPDSPATAFFESQEIVVDASWAISADGDAARLNLPSTKETTERRRATAEIMRGSLADATLSHAIDDVMWMLKHPDTLSDPALLERAAAVNRRAE